MRYLVLFSISLLLLGCTEGEKKILPKGPGIVNSLETLKKQHKFFEDGVIFYPGAPDEATRVKAEQVINDVLSNLIEASKNGITEEDFWSVLESAARLLGGMDSEEMDRGLSYMEDIMDIYGIESSGGRLNEWRYGFDPAPSH